MKKMRLVVSDFEDYHDTFPIWSKIYVEVDGIFFPDFEWWDATSSILEMWIENVIDLMNGYFDSCVLYFMDGDYSIKLTRKNNDEAVAVCIAPQSKLVISSNITLSSLGHQLLLAGEKIINVYSDQLETSFVNNLSNKVNKLRNIIENNCC